MAVGGPDAVAAGIAAADDDDVLVGGEDWFGVDGEVADPFVLLLQKFHREMDAFEAAAGDRQIAGDGGAASQYDRVKFAQQVIDADIRAYFGVTAEGDAGFFHQPDPTGDNPFLQLEIRDAIPQ